MEARVLSSGISVRTKPSPKCQIWKQKRLFYDEEEFNSFSSFRSSSKFSHHFRAKTSHVYRQFTSPGAILLSIMVILLKTSPTTAQVTRPFPEVQNLAENRPVVSNPSDSACGVPTRNAYCESSVYPISVQQCTQLFCVQICPNRTSLPDPLDLLIATSPGLGTCVVTDAVNVHPNNRIGEFSTFFVQTGQLCYVTPSSLLRIGADGGFTVSFWVWQEASNNG